MIWKKSFFQKNVKSFLHHVSYFGHSSMKEKHGGKRVFSSFQKYGKKLYMGYIRENKRVFWHRKTQMPVWKHENLSDEFFLCIFSVIMNSLFATCIFNPLSCAGRLDPGVWRCHEYRATLGVILHPQATQVAGSIFAHGANGARISQKLSITSDFFSDVTVSCV